MVHIWRVVQWWDEWELRILVLGSLGLQWFLLLAAPMRKYSIPRVCRTCIWLAYISSDALAIYALATLFNRHARGASNNACGATSTATTTTTPGSSTALEVLWAPILLIHLGGQKEMTGYTIEDNELWMRHAVTLVSQAAIALYTFCKSWHSSNDLKLLSAAVLLFIVGVASLSEKPFALNKANTTKRLAAVSPWVQRKRKNSKWTERIGRFFQGGIHSTLPMVRMEEDEEEETSGRRRMRRGWCGNKERNKGKQVVLLEADKLLMVLSDMSLLAMATELVATGKAYSIEEVLPPMLMAEKVMPRSLRNAFAFIYTRATVAVTPLYLAYHVLVVPILHIVALMLFARSDKHPYKRADVKITYIVLCLTATLDILAEFIRQMLYMLMSMTTVPALCETVPSYNIIDAALIKAGKSMGWIYRIYRCARGIRCSCLFNNQNAQLFRIVTQTVIIDLVVARQRDLASYRIFDDSDTNTIHSQNWVLRKELQMYCGFEIRKVLSCVSFDRSVLLWHIATDLCRRCSIDDATMVDDRREEEEKEKEEEEEEEEEVVVVGGGGGGGEEPEEQEQHTRERDPALQLYRMSAIAISDYMAHLLNENPEMLLTGSRHHLISEALNEVKDYISWKKMSNTLSLEDIDIIIGMHPMSNEDYSQVFHMKEACKLAKELLALQEDTRWELMYRVWLGMLCYSASMCRGYLHAKSLSEGGEFLSYVWLMLMLKGAKSLADKHQMPLPRT